jgi:patatin-related protein
MYGGVSLAIYINGIAQELFRLVRATAPANPDNPDHPLLLNAELKGTERVYRKVGQMLTGHRVLKSVGASDPIRTRFVIDVLSGTSAGGINAIFLAKALANNQPLDDLKRLWVEEGDISLLLNDKHSVKKEPLLSLQDPPASLLNSKRMYLKLLNAFDGMEAAGSNERSPYGDEIDLYVTATDIHGVTVPLRLADDIVYERRHKNVFHFRYYATPHGDPSRTDFALSAGTNAVYLRNDFARQFNPFLAFAARCTSSFPFAFEPMRLGDIDEFVRRIEPYNRTDLSSSSPLWERFIENYRAVQTAASIPFSYRFFGDGGYLDNKPFSYAIDALVGRRASLPVDRKLIYIEPAPQHPEDFSETTAKPDALENVQAAVLTLPRYETIREDLQRVLQRNALVDRIMRITRGIEDDVNAVKGARVELKKGIDWANQDLKEMIRQKGIGYGGYQRLKVGAVTDELAELIVRAAGLDEHSDHLLGVRYLIRAWRSKHYTVYYDKSKPKEQQLTENRFLLDFDLGYRIRRVQFVQGKLDVLYGGGPAAESILKSIGIDFDLDGKEAERFRNQLVAMRARLNEAFSVLNAAREALLARLDKNPMHEHVIAIGITGQQLEDILRRSEDERMPRAREIVSDRTTEERLKVLADRLAEFILKATGESSRMCMETLRPPKGEKETPERIARECLWHYYQYYDDYDLITFPALYNTGVGEMDTVEVVRISPEDARSLIDERAERQRPGGRSKLAGTALGNFGAFLDTLWRKNDILWGRLDGAERIISAMLPGEDLAEQRKALIAEAHAAILEEDLQPEDRQEICGVLADILARTSPNKHLSASALRDILEEAYGSALDSKMQAVFRYLLSKEQLLEYFRTGYSVRREPDPQAMLKNLSRSTRIIGKMLEGLAEKRSMNKTSVAWIARIGQIFWSLVIVAAPDSLLSLIFRHWLKVLYTFEGLLLLFGTILTISPMQQLALTLLGITVGVHLVVRLLGDYMRGRNVLLRVLLVLVVAGLLVLAALGVDTLFGHPALKWLAERYQEVMRWFGK